MQLLGAQRREEDDDGEVSFKNAHIQSPEMKIVHRWQHTDEQWNRMIADELAAGRPIYYIVVAPRNTMDMLLWYVAWMSRGYTM